MKECIEYTNWIRKNEYSQFSFSLFFSLLIGKIPSSKIEIRRNSDVTLSDEKSFLFGKITLGGKRDSRDSSRMRVDRVVSSILEKIRCGTRRSFIDTFAMNKRYRVIGGINNTAWKILAICLVYSLLSGLSIDCSIVLFIAYSSFFVYNLSFFHIKYISSI